MNKLYIVGYGVGDEGLLTERAKEIITDADTIFSTDKRGRNTCAGKTVERCSLAELEKCLRANTNGKTVVLVRGDCCFFSASKTIGEKFASMYEIEMINGISSVQYLCGKLAVPYDDAVICSMHGKFAPIVPKVAYNKKVIVLTGGAYKANNICEILCERGLSHVHVHVGERLSYPNEKIVTGSAKQLKDVVFDNLSVMLIQNDCCKNPHLPLYDNDFIRGAAPMTKSEVRCIAVRKLGISPEDVVYDVGAGTGAVSVEMARKAFDGHVYAIESDEEACGLIEKNRIKHGAYNVEIVQGTAPEVLKSLPKPDKAFIGGSGGNIDGILNTITEKNKNVTVVSNAITVQSVYRILEGYRKYGIENDDVVCVNISKSKKINGYDMMMAQNPVYVITGKGDRINE